MCLANPQNEILPNAEFTTDGRAFPQAAAPSLASSRALSASVALAVCRLFSMRMRRRFRSLRCRSPSLFVSLALLVSLLLLLAALYCILHLNLPSVNSTHTRIHT